MLTGKLLSVFNNRFAVSLLSEAHPPVLASDGRSALLFLQDQFEVVQLWRVNASGCSRVNCISLQDTDEQCLCKCQTAARFARVPVESVIDAIDHAF